MTDNVDCNVDGLACKPLILMDNVDNVDKADNDFTCLIGFVSFFIPISKPILLISVSFFIMHKNVALNGDMAESIDTFKRDSTCVNLRCSNQTCKFSHKCKYFAVKYNMCVFVLLSDLSHAFFGFG